jgi:hypothetical protein
MARRRAPLGVCSEFDAARSGVALPMLATGATSRSMLAL